MNWRQAPWALCLYLNSTPAGAEVENYWVDWSAPPNCPGASRLHDEVAARSVVLRVSREGQHIGIRVTEDTSGYYLARAVLPSGKTREVKAKRCDDVIAALAFIVVMELDENVRHRAAEGAVISATSAPVPAEEASTSAPRWWGYAGATGGISGGRTPNLMPTGGLFYELWQEGGLFNKGARASVTFGTSRLASVPDTVSLRLVDAVTELCPIGVSIASVCAGMGLGVMHVQSGAALSSEQNLRFPLVGRAGLHFRQVFGNTWLGELGVGILLPITLDQFVVERQDKTLDELHVVSISGYASVSVGYRL